MKNTNGKKITIIGCGTSHGKTCFTRKFIEENAATMITIDTFKELDSREPNPVKTCFNSESVWNPKAIQKIKNRIDYMTKFKP